MVKYCGVKEWDTDFFLALPFRIFRAPWKFLRDHFQQSFQQRKQFFEEKSNFYFFFKYANSLNSMDETVMVVTKCYIGMQINYTIFWRKVKE